MKSKLGIYDPDVRQDIQTLKRDFLRKSRNEKRAFYLTSFIYNVFFTIVALVFFYLV